MKRCVLRAGHAGKHLMVYTTVPSMPVLGDCMKKKPISTMADASWKENPPMIEKTATDAMDATQTMVSRGVIRDGGVERDGARDVH